MSFVTGFLFAMFAEELAVHWRNDELHISAPKLHFIAGHSLDRLKSGDSVPFDFQLLLWRETRGNLTARSLERFVVSYDLWEEKFAVTKVRANASLREGTSVSHLTGPAAEAWCVDHIALPSPGLGPTQPFWVRLEIRSAEPRQTAGVVDESGVSLTRLIDLFSHPIRSDQQKWTVEAGPLKLDDLKRSARGS
jgi:hypothetical protein